MSLSRIFKATSKRSQGENLLIVIAIVMLLGGSAQGSQPLGPRDESLYQEKKVMSKEGTVARVMQYLPEMKEASARTGVPVPVIASTMEHESGGSPKATSYNFAKKSKTYTFDGKKVTLTVPYVDSNGNTVKLGDYIAFKSRPGYRQGDLVNSLDSLKVVNSKGKLVWRSGKRPDYPAQIARGLMQCIESTAGAKEYGSYAFDDLYYPLNSIDCGARVLADLASEAGSFAIGPISAGYFSGKANVKPVITGRKYSKKAKKMVSYSPSDEIKNYMSNATILLKEWEERLGK